MGQHLPDIISTINSCVLFVLITMFWIHKAKPKHVSLSIANSLLIPLKIAFLHAIVFGALWPFPGYAAAAVPVLAVIALVVLPFATINTIPGGTDASGETISAFSVGRMLLIPAYGLRQFVTGFPDRDLLNNREPASASLIEEDTTPLWVED